MQQKQKDIIEFFKEQTAAALKSGNGIDDSNRIKKGECVCLGKGLYLSPVGSGLFLGTKSKNGLFLGPNPG